MTIYLKFAQDSLIYTDCNLITCISFSSRSFTVSSGYVCSTCLPMNLKDLELEK